MRRKRPTEKRAQSQVSNTPESNTANETNSMTSAVTTAESSGYQCSNR